MGRRAVKAKKDARLREAMTAGAVTRTARRGTSNAQQAAALRLAVDSARVLADDRCEDVLVLDLRGLSGFCDYFVIATGTSDRQMRATCEHVEDLAADRGEKPYSRAGMDGSSWLILDFVDVVVHVFDSEHRDYYELETLWGDAPRIEWQR
jgi:ribosome-associated protein